MKNLNFYNYNDASLGTTSYDFFKVILKSKRDDTLKTYFEDNQALVCNSHQLYDTNFTNNLLSKINESQYSKLIESNFKTLYSYNSSKIKKLRLAIQNLQDNSTKHKCQYCTINNHDTLDHFLPKSKYWEYVIHPLNLVPCCSDCNRKLSAKEDSSLNLYLDTLPTEQYLFVNITFTNSIPNFYFKLENTDNAIDDDLYAKIKQHFNSLNLLERMKEAAITEYTEFYNSIKNQLKYSNINTIRDLTLRSVQDNKISYGHNHWKYIFQEVLINNQAFIKLL